MRKGPIQGIAMGKMLHTEERLEFTDRGTVTEQKPNLSSRFELKEEHRDAGEGKTREGIHDLLRISGVSDLGEQKGKNHRRNGGGCARERGSAPVALPAPFLRGQKFPLGLGYFCHEALEQLPFLDPSLYLLTKFYGDIDGVGAFFFLPGQKSHFMERALGNAPATRIAAPFFGKSKGGLNEGLYLSEALQSSLPPSIGDQGTCHKYKYIYLPNSCQQENIHSAKKYSLLGWLTRRKAGLKRIGNAKNIQSSLLC